MKNSYPKNLLAIFIATSFYFSTHCALADEHHHVHDNTQSEEHMHDHGDNPLVTKVMFDQFELGDSDNSGVVDAQAWIGKDLDKFWLKVNAEKHYGEIEDAEVQALYSRAIATYWDIQIGLRKDIKPEPSRTWGVLGVHGLAPYFFDVDAALFVADGGRTAARFEAEYDLLLTQKLILSPNLEMNFYGQNDAETATGSGLANTQAGLRLRYEICREFAPYVGINWNKKFGTTANLASTQAQDTATTEWVLGLRFWF